MHAPVTKLRGAIAPRLAFLRAICPPSINRPPPSHLPSPLPPPPPVKTHFFPRLISLGRSGGGHCEGFRAIAPRGGREKPARISTTKRVPLISISRAVLDIGRIYTGPLLLSVYSTSPPTFPRSYPGNFSSNRLESPSSYRSSKRGRTRERRRRAPKVF